MSSPVALPKDPLPEIYVLWHPKCPIGKAAAQAIYEWLRPGYGLGPKVFYRSLPAPGSDNGLPLPLPGELRKALATERRDELTNLQIVVPLIDDHMIADGGFRYWLQQLGSTPPAHNIVRKILPVALDSTAYGAPPAIRELNFIRPRADHPIGDLDEKEQKAFIRS